MNSRWKKRMLRVWEILVQAAKRCEVNGTLKLFLEAILKVFVWWLTQK
jgi:hypothetical protein